ncbi:MAG: hypothetical protein IKU17_03080 [Clostridia bacterium]|nr:hypothetical protein [Clostridia bacterium]
MPKNLKKETRRQHDAPAGTQNDLTKEEYLSVAQADQADSGEESKSAFDLINEYGTYEIQRTADTSNAFPAIAQGYSKQWQFDKAKNRVEPTNDGP